MTGEERLQEFKKAIEDWKTSKHLKEIKTPKEDSRISGLLNMDSDKMRSLTSAECLMYAYELSAYAE